MSSLKDGFLNALDIACGDIDTALKIMDVKRPQLDRWLEGDRLFRGKVYDSLQLWEQAKFDKVTVLRAVKRKPSTIDQLARSTGLDRESVSSQLTALRLTGEVYNRNGIYMLTER